MPRLLALSTWAKRLTRGVPLARLILVAEVGLLASHHLRRLNGQQRRRFFSLLISARGRPRSLTPAERIEFTGLLARLEPRLLMGSAVRRFSPVPLPKRLLYGRRGSAARVALSRGD